MVYDPREIFAASSSSESSALRTSLRNRIEDDRQREEENAKRRAELNDLLADEGDKSNLEKIQDATNPINLLKKAAGAGLTALDYAGSITRHGLREAVETAGLRPNTEGLTMGEVFRSTDEADEAVRDIRATVQGGGGLAAVLAERNGMSPESVQMVADRWDKALRPDGLAGKLLGAVDTAGMAAADPLSYVTLGTGAAAKATLNTITRSAGDDVAEAVIKGGVRGGDDLLVQKAADAAAAAGGVADDAVTHTVNQVRRPAAGVSDDVIDDALADALAVSPKAAGQTVPPPRQLAAARGGAVSTADDVLQGALSSGPRSAVPGVPIPLGAAPRAAASAVPGPLALGGGARGGALARSGAPSVGGMMPPGAVTPLGSAVRGALSAGPRSMVPGAVTPLGRAAAAASVGPRVAAAQAIAQRSPQQLDAILRAGGDEAADVIEAVSRELPRGADEALALGGDSRLALGAAPKAAPQTIRDILMENAGTLGNRSLEETVARQLTNLERRGRGGLGILGYQTGIGASQAGAAANALRGTAPVAALASKFSPTSEVASVFGRPAAEAVDVAAHTGENARRAARNELADELSDQSTSTFEAAVRDAGEREMATDLIDFGGGRLAFDTQVAGSVPFGGKFVPKVVADALAQSIKTPTGPALQAADKALSIVKRFTTLGPTNAIPHVARNIVSNKFFAALFGGVYNPKYYIEARNLRKALVSTSEAARKNRGADLAGELSAKGLSPKEVDRALALHDQQLAGRGGSTFDDVDIAGRHGGAPSKGKTRTGASKDEMFGTRNAAAINNYDEEWTRGAVFLKGLDDGLDPRLASKKSREALLDYTSAGLTDFERDVMQRVVFFYKFPRRAVPRGLEFMGRYPGAAAALSNAGLGVAQGERNEYGETIGAFLDSPLEATVGTIADTVRDPGGTLNPFLKAALDPEARTVGDILPPVGSAQRFFGREDGEGALDSEGGITTGAPGPYGVGALLGLKEGQDYEKLRWEKDAEERIEKGEDSKTDRLMVAALEAGVQRPYAMTDAELARALLAAGVERQSLSSILSGE